MSEVINSFFGNYRFLSNFYPCQIDYEGITYQSTEHAFQAAKTEDMTEKLKIKNAYSPADAKKIGKKVKLRSDWENVKEAVMYDVLKLKFSQPYLKDKLLSTKDAELVEGNYWNDTYWGVCKGIGKNRLGILLMQLRKELLGTKEDNGVPDNHRYVFIDDTGFCFKTFSELQSNTEYYKMVGDLLLSGTDLSGEDMGIFRNILEEEGFIEGTDFYVKIVPDTFNFIEFLL